MGFLHFIPPGPAAGPLDWSLRANDLGEILIPFARYVQLDPPHRTHEGFPVFAQLPAELQFHILCFCDSATLFQLMQTSAALRREAKKLFWSDPDAWYRVGADWLVHGGLAGEAHFAEDFRLQVQQVEVSVEDMEDFLPPDNSSSETRTFRIHRFWSVLQLRFPRVIRVIMSEETARAAQSISPSLFQRLAEGCPSGIEFYGSVVTLDDPNMNLAIRSRTRFSSVEGHHQDTTQSPWVRQTVLMPPKVWRGPAGEYAEALYHDKQHLKRGCIWDVLVIQAIERDCLGKQGQVFSCPHRNPVCGIRFANGREWAIHATKTGHYMDAEMPALYRDEIVGQQMGNPFKKLAERYQKLNAQEREAHKQGIFNQLDQDPDYAEGCLVQKRDIWNLYLEIISGYIRHQMPL